jgi:hypothetical protein
MLVQLTPLFLCGGVTIAYGIAALSWWLRQGGKNSRLVRAGLSRFVDLILGECPAAGFVRCPHCGSIFCGFDLVPHQPPHTHTTTSTNTTTITCTGAVLTVFFYFYFALVRRKAFLVRSV